MLIDSGLNPKAPDAPPPAAVSMFKPPSEASVRLATQPLPQGPLRGNGWSRSEYNQRLYKVRASGVALPCACTIG